MSCPQESISVFIRIWIYYVTAKNTDTTEHNRTQMHDLTGTSTHLVVERVLKICTQVQVLLHC